MIRLNMVKVHKVNGPILRIYYFLNATGGFMTIKNYMYYKYRGLALTLNNSADYNINFQFNLSISQRKHYIKHMLKKI